MIIIIIINAWIQIAFDSVDNVGYISAVAGANSVRVYNIKSGKQIANVVHHTG